MLKYAKHCSLGIISLAACLLAVGMFTACAGENSPILPNEIIPVDVPSLSPEVSPVESAAPTPASLRYENVPSAAANDGALVLVNYLSKYEHTEDALSMTAHIGDNKSKNLLLTGSDLRLMPDTIHALNEFADGFFEATGGDRLLATSAFRTLEYQQQVYVQYVKERGEEMAKLYVADPGCSEHHTGYAVDLSTICADGARVPLIDHERFDWVNANCAAYGFILRYPVGSEGITRVAYEPWHFRYVGREHAALITELDMLYEEYVEHLRVYTADTEVLYAAYNADGGVDVKPVKIADAERGGFIVYYVKAESGDTTNIPLPDECLEYSVSGDNAGGFIITVKL